MQGKIVMKCNKGSLAVLDDKLIIDKKITGKRVIYLSDLIDVE